MVSLLIIGLILPYDKTAIKKLAEFGVTVTQKTADTFFWVTLGVSVLALIWAVWQSKRDTPEMAQS